MQVFKCGLKLVFRKPVYLIVYGLLLSFMGIFMAMSITSDAPAEEYEPYELSYAVINRDDGEVAQGLCDFLETQGEQVKVADETIAMQNAIAKGTVSFLVVIPDGFSEGFVKSVEAESEPPKLDCTYSYYSAEGVLAEIALSDYLSDVSTYMLAYPNESIAESCKRALATTEVTAPAHVISTGAQSSAGDQIAFYLQFDIYIYIAGIIVCAGLLLTKLKRTDVHRRNLASPLSYTRYSIQVALACVVVMLAFWAITMVLGIGVFTDAFLSITWQDKLLLAASSLTFALIPLGIAFLLGQLGVGETVMNAIGNIVGLVLSFLGGAWVPMDIMSPAVVTIAHFLPGYWYTDAVSKSVSFTGSSDALATIGADIGVMALFALAAFALGMVVGRARMQTSEAGGNAAAEVVTS